MGSTVIKVENLSKQYRLGEIGTGSIAHDLNRWWHNVRGKDDPYLKIGDVNDRTKIGNSDYVWSLKDIDFEIKQGEAYRIFACNGILFNHESPLRGETFVTRKITRAVAKIALGFQDTLFLGNLDAQRDWGHAKDYIEAMYLILQQDIPEDYVIATGLTTRVREFVRMAFNEVGIVIEFKGSGINEEGFVVSCSNPDYQLEAGKKVVAVDPKYFRPAEVDLLIGDPTKSKTKLGWKPKYDLAMLVQEMVAADVDYFRKENLLKDSGYVIKNEFE